MASGKLLRKLIRSGARGDHEAFRAATEAVIQEERQKKHHLLANDLERLLYAEQAAFGDGKGASGPAFFELPKSSDSSIPLMEERPAVREEKDIVLSDEARSVLEEILLEQNRADLLRSYGMQPAQKLLFCGPSGCGKTLAAEVLANSLSLPLVLVRIDSVVSSFLGETASNLRKVFDFVSRNPVVALFDEFDALAKDRGDDSDHGELKRSVNAVLQMLDSYRGESILIATTNYDDLLDPAVWRRFDETVWFEMPNLEQIKRLLELKLSGIRRNFELDGGGTASLFKGLSHAAIERVLRRAVKQMILSGREFLELADLKAALAREYNRKQPQG